MKPEYYFFFSYPYGRYVFLLKLFSIFRNIHAILIFLDFQPPLNDDTMVKDNRAMHVDSDIVRTKKRGRKDGSLTYDQCI